MTDTPDWQSGVYSPQQLLGAFPGSAATEVVTIPPNTESLIIVGVPTSATTSPTVVGVTSSLDYLVSQVPTPAGTGISPVFLASALEPIDSQVTIHWPGGVTGEWYVVADAGIRQILDLTLANILATAGDAATQLGLIVMGTDGTLARRLLTNQQGKLQVVSTVPDIATGDHPTNELLAVQVINVATGTVVVAAPGAGKRLRVFDVLLSNSTAFANLTGTYGGNPIQFALTGATAAVTVKDTIPLTGLALDTNTNLVTSSGAVASVRVLYTIETI